MLNIRVTFTCVQVFKKGFSKKKKKKFLKKGAFIILNSKNKLYVRCVY